MPALGTNDGFPVVVAVLLIVWVVVILGSLVLLVISLVDIVRRPEWQWKLAGQEKILWLLLVILVNFLAIPSLIYWFNIRRKLQAVEQAAASGRYGPGHMTYSGWEPAPAPTYSALPPAGWYPDASGQGQFRWWDGAQWTEHLWTGAPAPGQ